MITPTILLLDIKLERMKALIKKPGNAFPLLPLFPLRTLTALFLVQKLTSVKPFSLQNQ